MKQLDQDKTIIEELANVENEIAMEVGKQNRDKVVDAFKILANTDGTTNVNGMWGIKRKIFPKHSKQLPVAKKNTENKIISSQEELKKLYLNTFKRRLVIDQLKTTLKL